MAMFILHCRNKPWAMTAVVERQIAKSSKPEGSKNPERVAPYRSNLRDIKFNLFEVFGRGKILGKEPFGVDVDDARNALSLMDELAKDVIAPTFVDGDRNPPQFDPESRTVTTSPTFKEAFHTYMNADPFLFGLPTELGGFNAPPSITRALTMPSLGANPAFHFATLGPEMSRVLYNLGSKQEGEEESLAHKVAKKVVKRKWGATMVLTEADAGSDVGAMITTAVKQSDGSWHLKGVKRFITTGEQDVTENIVHAMLARTVDENGKTIPGTKGLGLFLVSKYHLDPQTGDLVKDKQTGELKRNGVYATGLEDKMGIKASPTCEMTFGEGEPAVGYLISGEHDGIKGMFQVIENARMMIGVKSAETLSRAYLDALDYAKTREQFGKRIIEFPGVRNKLMTMKAYAEGLRALIHYTTTFQDDIAIAHAEGRTDKRAESINDLLLPVVKGFGSERATHLLNDALQVFGGSGFVKDFPMEQYVRDAKIDTIYEGTTDIQSLDFVFRKFAKDKGRSMGILLREVLNFAAPDVLNRKSGEIFNHTEGKESLKAEKWMLAKALWNFGHMYKDMLLTAKGAKDSEANFNKVAQSSQRFMEAFGDLMVGYLLLRQADVARGKVDTVTGEERDFYQGKIDTARFFARTVLPRLSSDSKVIKNNLNTRDFDLVNVSEGSF